MVYKISLHYKVFFIAGFYFLGEENVYKVLLCTKVWIMKLTKTQKKFRKEMAQAVKEVEKLYDNPYDQPYVRKKKSSGGGWIFGVIFVAIIVFAMILGSENPSDSPPADIKELGSIAVSARNDSPTSDQTSQSSINHMNKVKAQLQTRVLSRSEADVLSQIDSAEIDETLIFQHKVKGI